MYCISCIAYPVSHILYTRPWEATGHQKPREATGSHGRPREATGRTGGHGPHPTVPPKILYLLKWAGRGRQKGRLRRKPATGGHGGPRGATGGHGAAQKKSAHNHRPLQYPRGPLQAVACLGNICIHVHTHTQTCTHTHIRTYSHIHIHTLTLTYTHTHTYTH